MNDSKQLFINGKWRVLSLLILAGFAISFRGLSQEPQPPVQRDGFFTRVYPNAPKIQANTNAYAAKQEVQTNAQRKGFFNGLFLNTPKIRAEANNAVTQEAQANNTTVNEVYVTNLTGIVIVANSDDVKPAGVADVQGVVVNGPKFLQRPDFEKLLERHLNAPLTDASSKEMQVEIIKYCRSLGHSVVDVFYREQEIINGTIQIAVVEGKIGKITVENEGHKWFSDALILDNMHLRPGEPVMQKQLDSDIGWLNQNTYESLGTFERDVP